MKRKDRYYVTIYCKQCGERYRLRGSMKNGTIETGFKQCLCDNDHDFEIKSEKLG